MKLIEINTEDRQQVSLFLKLPFRLYSNVPQWVPPLEQDARQVLNRKRNPYFQHGEAAFYLLLNHQGEPTGRLAVLDNQKYNQFNQEKTAFFYLFECEDDQKSASLLFEAAFNWARARGLTSIIGPKGFTVFDGQGLLVRGFEHRPAFGLPYHLPYYARLIEAVGFTPSSELASGYIDRNTQFPEKIHLMADLLKTRRGYRVAPFASRKDLRLLVPKLADLYNGALVETSGNSPITEEEARNLGNQMIWFADPKLIKVIYKDEQPIGFLLAYPDISAAIQRTHGRVFPFGWLHLLLERKRTKWININGAGMVAGHRGVGGTALLFSEMCKSIESSQYAYADVVQIGTKNDKMMRELRDLGIDFYKLHRIYTYNLE